MNYQAHWEKVYRTRQSWEVSWTQEIPEISLQFIHAFHLSKKAPIIDIGGGDSKLVDLLLQEGYLDITVLDISVTAIEKAKKRLGRLAERVQWQVCDVADFHPERKYKIWHDRAAFHFLVTEKQISRYLDIAARAVDHHGFVVMSTFSTSGPDKCSGLEIRKYSEATLTKAESKF
jgi:2-polyprenyl-3-methyl-5-hydroxy-6-metoxy-1,4-benzoquinol methylase